MGGRGSSGGGSGKTTLREFLGKRGLASPVSDWDIDKLRIPHGETLRQRNERIKEGNRRDAEYSEKRSAAIKEYKSLLAAGKIKEKSRIEVLVETARGHSDNQATQAARRTLEKRGIDWQTGRKKKKK